MYVDSMKIKNTFFISVYIYIYIYIYIYLYIYNTCIHTIDPRGYHLIGFMAAGTFMFTYVRLQLDNWTHLKT